MATDAEMEDMFAPGWSPVIRAQVLISGETSAAGGRDAEFGMVFWRPGHQNRLHV